MTTEASTTGRLRSANGRFMAKDAAAVARNPTVAGIPDTAASPVVAKGGAKDEKKPKKSGGKKAEHEKAKPKKANRAEKPKKAEPKKSKKAEPKKSKKPKKSGGKKSKKSKK